ncbi:hypothetical protein JL721_41 [Aureococcus anophagefferens]|nr:hypothetical protein JL721_41 [Aureococcus anophagefferens]
MVDSAGEAEAVARDYLQVMAWWNTLEITDATSTTRFRTQTDEERLQAALALVAAYLRGGATATLVLPVSLGLDDDCWRRLATSSAARAASCAGASRLAVPESPAPRAPRAASPAEAAAAAGAVAARLAARAVAGGLRRARTRAAAARAASGATRRSSAARPPRPASAATRARLARADRGRRRRRGGAGDARRRRAGTRVRGRDPRRALARATAAQRARRAGRPRRAAAGRRPVASRCAGPATRPARCVVRGGADDALLRAAAPRPEAGELRLIQAWVPPRGADSHLVVVWTARGGLESATRRRARAPARLDLAFKLGAANALHLYCDRVEFAPAPAAPRRARPRGPRGPRPRRGAAPRARPRAPAPPPAKGPRRRPFQQRCEKFFKRQIAHPMEITVLSYLGADRDDARSGKERNIARLEREFSQKRTLPTDFAPPTR